MTVELVDVATGEILQDLSAVEARELVDSIRLDVADIDERVTRAYLGRAWLALGHADWDALCIAEFDGARLRIPREQRQDLVLSLRESGLSQRAIGSALGIDKRSVGRDLASAGGADAPPAPVTGQDGKTYPSRTPARQPAPASPPPVKRKPFTDAFTEASNDLRKTTERLERLCADDRFPTNAEQVATRHGSDLLRAAEALARVLSRLP